VTTPAAPVPGPIVGAVATAAENRLNF